MYFNIPFKCVCLPIGKMRLVSTESASESNSISIGGSLLFEFLSHPFGSEGVSGKIHSR